MKFRAAFVMICATLFCAAGVGAVAAAEEPIRVFAADLNAAPYVVSDGVQFVGGIVKDLNDEAARRTGRSLTYVMVARKSVDDAFLSGEGHVECTTQPAWTGIADKLTWTGPLYADRDEIWALAGGPIPKTLADLKGKSFVTFKGYHYSDALTAMVAAGEVKRVDLFPNQNVFDALMNKRADFAMFADIRGDYELRERGLKDKIVKTELVEQSYSLHCALSPKFPGDVQAYKAAVESIVTDGTMAKILARYR